MSTSRGPWVQTFTGKAFFPFDPRVEDICIEDIAHALSNICRFNGQVRTFYSVAQHSVAVSRMTDTDRLRWLLHDASEAYLGDMVSPLKHDPRLGEAYRAIEAKVQRVIHQKFGLGEVEHDAALHKADLVMLATEARDLMAKPPELWHNPERPLTIPFETEWQFMVAQFLLMILMVSLGLSAGIVAAVGAPTPVFFGMMAVIVLCVVAFTIIERVQKRWTTIRPWSPRRAERAFLAEFRQITEKDVRRG